MKKVNRPKTKLNISKDVLAQWQEINQEHESTPLRPAPEGWYSVVEIAKMWNLAESTTAHKLVDMLNAGKVERIKCHKAREDGEQVLCYCYGLKDKDKDS